MTDTTEDRADHTEVVIGLFEPGVADDPHPAYRACDPSAPSPAATWAAYRSPSISRYEDVQWALRHPETFTSASGMELGEQPLLPLEVDPPVHTHYRRILNPRFVPERIATLEPEVRTARARAARRLRRAGLVRLPRGVRHAAAVGHLPGADGSPAQTTCRSS